MSLQSSHSEEGISWTDVSQLVRTQTPSSPSQGFTYWQVQSSHLGKTWHVFDLQLGSNMSISTRVRSLQGPGS